MVLLWLAVAVLFALGLLGVVIPFLPGIGLVFGGILLYAATTDFTVISSGAVGVFAVVALLAWLAEYAGGALGARFGGGGPLTIIGAIIGAIVGVLFTPLGLLIGSFVGALAGALIELPRHDQALKAATLAVIGIVATKLLQLVVSVGMIVTFLILVIS
ncbi:hypothetical protein CL628_03580 [bacterium]|nr:hypothetical protein [bacterium]